MTSHDITTTLTVYNDTGGKAAEIDRVIVTIGVDEDDWWVNAIAIRNPVNGIYDYYLFNEPVFSLLEALVDRAHIDSELQRMKEDA